MKKLLYILTLFILWGCGNTPQKGEKPIITVTIEPLRYFTEAIAGEHFEVVSMVPNGSSPESYDPTPQQLVALGNSQAYLRIGYIGFEQAWMKKLEANHPNMKVYDTSQGIDLIRGEGHWHGDHFHEGGVEPHIWNSTRNASIIADNIYEQADAMIDLMYFALGTMVEMGLEADELFSIVQQANMAKLWPDGKPHYNPKDGKVIKPEGWEDPAPKIKAYIDSVIAEKAK